MTLVNIDKAKVGFDLRGSWQARAFTHATDKMKYVVLSVLAENYDDSVAALVPNGVRGPFFCSAAKISRGGKVYADMISRDEERKYTCVVFRSETEMQSEFRKLADELKFSDADRVEMFAAVKKWIVCDFRLDPTTGEKERPPS